MIKMQIQLLGTKRKRLQVTKLSVTTFHHLEPPRRKFCCRRRTIHSHCDSRICIERRSLLALGDGTSSRSAPGRYPHEKLVARIWSDRCRWSSCGLSRTRTFRCRRQNPVQGHSRTDCFVCSFQGGMWWASISKRERMIRRQSRSSRVSLTFPSVEATKLFSHAHLWSKHVTFVVNLRHSSSDRHCSPIFTRLLHALSCLAKFSRQRQTPPLQNALLSYFTHCSFISQGWSKWAVSGMHRLESLVSTNFSLQAHFPVSRLQLAFGIWHGQFPSLLLNATSWKLHENRQ